MDIFWIGAALSLLALAVFLSARLACYRKQLSHMLKELDLARKSETNILFTSAVRIGKTEEIISALNDILESSRRSRQTLIRENQSYRESISSISHDIRTPLTSAKGYLQMMGNPAVPEATKQKYAQIIERRLDGLSDMLDQLFLYTRIEAGAIPLHMEYLNASNLFAETVSLFYGSFLEKNCEPKITLPQHPCRIYADRQAFVRIAGNLIKNALVHGTGGYELSLMQAEGAALLRVSNETGTIEASDIGHIFDRFYTTDKSRSRKTTGLGLTIVKELAVRMDGEAKAWLEGNIFSIEVRFPTS